MATTIQKYLKDFWHQTRDYTVKGYLFLLVRLYLGIFYIQTGTHKLETGGLGLGYMDSVVSFVNDAIQNAEQGVVELPPSDLYVAFLKSVVLPRPEIFTYLVSWGETFLGFALLFGVFTRLAGFMGAFMAMNFLLASGRGFFNPSLDALLTYCLLTLAVAQAGRIFGVDVFLAKWKPKSWIW